MKAVVVVATLLAVSACGAEPRDSKLNDESAAEAAVPVEARQSQPAKVIPLPKDQADLDRMILAGFTPHADHLHPPGMKSCPLSKGGEAVM